MCAKQGLIRSRWPERFLFVVGMICLGAALVLIAEGWAYQLFARWQLGTVQAAEIVTESAGPEQARALTFLPAPAPGTPLGTIAIPDVGLDAVILEGIEADVLRRGVGHFPQTSMPGTGGNFALAGHRDTFFRGLRDIEIGHRVVIATADGRELVYRVESTEVVEPTAVQVLDDQGGEALTLVTCYPFRYVGPAPRRFIVRGRPLGS